MSSSSDSDDESTLPDDENPSFPVRKKRCRLNKIIKETTELLDFYLSDGNLWRDGFFENFIVVNHYKVVEPASASTQSSRWSRHNQGSCDPSYMYEAPSSKRRKLQNTQPSYTYKTEITLKPINLNIFLSFNSIPEKAKNIKILKRCVDQSEKLFREENHPDFVCRIDPVIGERPDDLTLAGRTIYVEGLPSRNMAGFRLYEDWKKSKNYSKNSKNSKNSSTKPKLNHKHLQDRFSKYLPIHSKYKMVKYIIKSIVEIIKNQNQKHNQKIKSAAKKSSRTNLSNQDWVRLSEIDENDEKSDPAIPFANLFESDVSYCF